MMKQTKEKVSITLDQDVVEDLRRFADESARPFSQYINYVLRSHVRAVTKRRENMAEEPK